MPLISLFSSRQIENRSTHRLDLCVIFKHDLVFVVDVAKLLLGDVDPRLRDEKDLALLENGVKSIDDIVEARRSYLALCATSARVGIDQGEGRAVSSRKLTLKSLPSPFAFVQCLISDF